MAVIYITTMVTILSIMGIIVLMSWLDIDLLNQLVTAVVEFIVENMAKVFIIVLALAVPANDIIHSIINKK